MSATTTLKRRMPSAHAPTRKQVNDRPDELGAPPVLIEVNRLEPHPDNPRDDFGDEDPELVALADSLQTVKLIQPIHVEELDRQTERFRIIAGERRWRAAQLAGWKTIPCVVCRLPRAAAVRLMVDENLRRKDLNPIEQARAIELLTRPESEGGAGVSQKAISRQRGGDESWAAQQVRLLKLPKYWQDLVASRELHQRQGKALIPYVDRADVLAAVKADRKANPGDWKSSEGFERQLAEVVARLDGLAAGPADVSGDGETGFVSQETKAPETLPMRRSAPVNHDAGGQVDRIVAMVEQLDTLEQLDQVQQAVHNRGCVLRAPRTQS